MLISIIVGAQGQAMPFSATTAMISLQKKQLRLMTNRS